MTLSKLDLLLIAAFVTGAFLIEHKNHARMEAPTVAEVSAPPAAACPTNESVPFSAECMMFIQGSLRPVDARRPGGADGTTAGSPELP